MWLDEDNKTTPSELQEAVAMSLINNQYNSERTRLRPGDAEYEPFQSINDPADCMKHPQYKKIFASTVTFVRRCIIVRVAVTQSDLLNGGKRDQKAAVK